MVEGTNKEGWKIFRRRIHHFSVKRIRLKRWKFQIYVIIIIVLVVVTFELAVCGF
jgi:hypothetical protein